jgi:hypothetical protein
MNLASGYMAVYVWVTVTMKIRLSFPIFPLFDFQKFHTCPVLQRVAILYLLIPYFHDKSGFGDALTVFNN